VGNLDRTDNVPVSSYHTGAGENDATLSTDISVASPGFYNATGWYQEFDLGTTFQWGLLLAYTATYTTWSVDLYPFYFG
jgi:hypothetical protein